MADYFVSYTSSDREWADWIGRELKALGHEAHVHEWEIEGGADILGWMESHLESADHVLCIVSDAYLRAPYSTLERNAALWRATKQRSTFALFVVVKPCKLPALVDHLKRCELFGLSEDARRERFRAFVRDPAPPAGGLTVPTQVFALSNIPIRVPEHFLGRDDALAAVDSALKRHDGRVAITALHGLRGVGKTTLAAAYADLHRTQYRATWWIRAQTESTMRADLAALGVRLGWVAADEKEEPALARVRERLRHEGEGLLLIYDNAVDAESLRPYLPPAGGARVLVTSNARVWRGIAAPVEIAVWPKEIGADYLIVRTGRSAERADAEALSLALGGLPLAHEQAAAYCERLEVSFAEYRKRFDAAPARLLDDVKHAPLEYNDGLTVAKTFALAIEKAGKLHPAAEPLIVHAALLAPEPIPLFLFTEGREKFAEPLRTLLADEGLEEALAALRAFALVDRETIPDEREPGISTECIRLHRLVREVAAGRCAGEAREEGRRRWVDALGSLYPQEGHHSARLWLRARRVDTLAIALLDADHPVPNGSESASSFLLNQLANYRAASLADYPEARLLFERALAMREKAFGAEHPDTATSVNDLALLLRTQGDFAGARSLQERSLAIFERAFGQDHRETATNLANLAAILNDQGDLTGSQALHERALAIREKALGPEHPLVASSLNHLAELLRARGDLASAQPLQEHALAIREKVLGSEHPETAESLNNLALLLKSRGNLAASRPLLERALAIREKAFGPEHPETAQGLNNLAELMRAQGHVASARSMFERALAIREKVFGREHPATGTILNNLALLLQAEGDLGSACALFERSLAICEKANGPEHPLTATSLNNLALLRRAQGDFVHARSLLERAILIQESALGHDRPDTALSLSNLASLLQAQGDLVGARELFERALSIREKALLSQHPFNAATLNELAILFQTQGELELARPLLERALAINEKALGPENPKTAMSLSNLGAVLQMQGNWKAARPLLERAIEIREKSLGPNHPEVATGITNLARVLRDAGEAKEAELHFLRAISIGEKAHGRDHSLTRRYASHYARLLCDAGRATEALTLAQAALAAHVRDSGANHPWTKDSARVTADALDALGRTDEAETVRARYGIGGGA